MKQFTIIKPGTRINFLGVRKRFALLSTALILGAIAMLIINVFSRGTMLNYGIDFRGGTQIQLEFQKQDGLNTSAVRKAMEALKYKRVEVIKVTSRDNSNAYVIRMENPRVVGQAGDGKALDKIFKARFQRSVVTVTVPAKDPPKPEALIAAIDKLGVAGVRNSPLARQPRHTVRLLVPKVLDAPTTTKLKTGLAAELKVKVDVETIQTLRRFKPARSGDAVTVIFSEDVNENAIRDAFAAAKVDISPSAGSVARRGRQKKHKIKWKVLLVGLADKLTQQLNQELKQFVKSTGKLQTLQFALTVKPTDEALKLALRQAGYGAGSDYAVQVTFVHPDERKPADVRKELKEVGLALSAGAALRRVGEATDRRWSTSLTFKAFTPVKAVEAKLKTKKLKLEGLSVRLNEARYQAAIKDAGYGPEDAIALRVVFRLTSAKNAKEVEIGIKAAKLPRMEGKPVQVGEAGENKWMIVLNIAGKQSGVDLEQKLAQVDSAGITAVEIPPHGAVKGIQSVVRVGSKVGRKLRVDGILSLLYTLGLILLYIGLRFDLKFAPGAVVALAHDVMITVGIWAVFWIEFNLSTIAALLTIVGYSLNDTIVVFDRIRENISRLRDANLEKVINTSLNETLSRTVLTSITTLGAIAAILFLASGDLWIFALALTIGILVGTYSSIYIASPVVLFLDGYFATRTSVSRTSSLGGGGGGDGGGKRARQGYQKREKKNKDGQPAGAGARG